MVNKRRYQDGFSLVEVIIAVAILAVLSMPILLYFTDAAVHSAQGKWEQEADMAAQSVIEEIDAVDNFASLEGSLQDSGLGWSVTSPAADADGTAQLVRSGINVNGHTYTADVTVDYGSYSAGDPADYITEFNDYDNPHFQQVYSDGSVAINETDEVETGWYNLYYEANGASSGEEITEKVKLEDIKAGMVRTFVISVISENDTTYRVRGGYKFSYTKPSTTNTYTTEVILKDTKIEKAKFSSVFFMFKPLNAEEKAQIILDNSITKEQANNMSITFVRKNDGTIMPSGIEISLDSAGSYGNYQWIIYHCNAKDADGNRKTGADGLDIIGAINPKDLSKNDAAEAGTKYDKYDLVDKSKDKRIAYIKVEVYQANGSGNKTGEVLATSTTSKAV